jgi:HEAT repeat protein
MKNKNSNPDKIPCSFLAFVVLALALIVHDGAGAQEKEQLSSTKLKSLTARLRSRFHADREQAVETLSNSGKQAVNLLAEAANSDYPHEREGALRVLCGIDPAKTGEFLCEAVLSDSISLRLTAMSVAKNLGIAGSRALLAKSTGLSQDKKEALRPILASACMKEVKEILSKIASSPEAGGVFYGQYRKLAKLGSVVEPALSRIAADPSQNFAEDAAAALSELGDKAAVPALKRAYLFGGRDLKETAAAALHILGEDGPYNEIVSNYRKICEAGNQNAYNEFSLFCCRAKEYAQGEKIMREVITRFGGTRLDHINLACFLSSQNKVKEAFEEFVKGVEKGYTNMEWVKIDGELANLRASKQFKDFVRTKFPEAFKEPGKPEEDGED